MLPARWQSVTRTKTTSRILSLSTRRSGNSLVVAGCRFHLRPPIARPRPGQTIALRTLLSPRPLFPSAPTSRLPSSSRRVSPFSSNNGVAGNATILRSAFPTKTVLFVLVLGGLAYYFTEIEYDSLENDIFATFVADDQTAELAAPCHFNDSREHVDHWLQFHLPDLSRPYRDPEVGRMVSQAFAKLAFGWMLTGDDAKIQGISDTHGCRLRSNEPCEDYFAIGTSPGPGEKSWNFWSVMDGHIGRNTSSFLQWALIPHVSRTLLGLPAHASSPQIVEAMKNCFINLDKQILDSGRTAANWFPAGNAAALAALAPAVSGSCALLAAFDPEKSVLRVACVGDSRAVLGRWDSASQSYTCIPLSEDQTGFNPKEVERITAAHPDEPDVIDPKTGRVLGIAVSRAFGDSTWKWDDDFVKKVGSEFFGYGSRKGNKTPPYLTAEPEITETSIVSVDPKDKSTRSRSDFMIMASDGLWDHMSSEHAVECVSRYLDARARGNGSVQQDPQLLANPPVFPANNAPDPGVDLSKGYLDWKATPEYFAIEDDNAAVCLARNALGGTRRNLFLGLLSLDGAFKRSGHDDMTILVVFFDKASQEDVAKAKSARKKWSIEWPWS